MNYATPQDWLNDNHAWNIWHDESSHCVYSIRFMNDEELRDSILEDILQVTFYEKRNNTTMNFTYETLVRNLKDPDDLKRLKDVFDKSDVLEYVSTDPETNQLRIIDSHQLQQAMMDMIGVWMEGFEVPDREGIIRVNTEVLKEKIEQHGGIDNLAAALAMEIESTVPSNTTVN